MNLAEARATLNRLAVRRRKARKRLRVSERYLYMAEATRDAERTERLQREVAERRAELDPIEDAHRRLAELIRQAEARTSVHVADVIVKLSKK